MHVSKTKKRQELVRRALAVVCSLVLLISGVPISRAMADESEDSSDEIVAADVVMAMEEDATEPDSDADADDVVSGSASDSGAGSGAGASTAGDTASSSSGSEADGVATGGLSADAAEADDADGSGSDSAAAADSTLEVAADDDGTAVCTVDGTGYGSISDAVSAIAATDSKSGTIVVTADSEMDSRITISEGIDVTINDDGSAHTVTQASTIIVEEGGKLTIDASNLTLINDGEGKSSEAAFVYCYGTFELDSGTFDYNGCSPSPYGYGGGVVTVSGENAVFTMNGGTITNASLGNVRGGVKVCSYGTFNMKGGTISKMDGGTAGQTGAVLVYADNSSSIGKGDATFNMSGGTIEDNTGFRGPAVCVYGTNYSYRATFNMSGGTIQNNTATNSTSLQAAGAVYIYGNAEMTMSGGTIAGNTVDGGMGGGVAVDDGWSSNESTWVNAYGEESAFSLYNYYYPASFTMTGGTISNNKAYYSSELSGTTGCGGGVYVASNSVTLSGGQITGNYAESQGGGVYVASTPYVLHLYNVLVSDNTASVLGGGIWACSTGDIEVFVTEGGAVFDNDAESSDGSKTSSEAGDDIASVAKDDEDAGSILLELSGRILGGGDTDWYVDGGLSAESDSLGIADGTSSRYDTEGTHTLWSEMTTTVATALIDVVETSDAETLAEAEAELVISGNSSKRGGGIGTNGSVVIGTDETTTVTVTKTWDDGDDAYSARPDSITLDLYNTVTSSDGTSTSYLIDTETVSEDDVTVNEDGSWTYTFEDLPADSDYSYSVEEESVAGYETTCTTTQNEDGSYSASIVNSLVDTSLTVSVVWDDDNDADGLRPGSVTVGLYRVVVAEDGSEELVAVTASDDGDDADGDDADGEAVTATIDEDGGWTYTFSGLPAYDEDGEAIEYAVVEVAVDGYETSYSDVTGSVDDGYNVTVTNVHEPEGDGSDGESEGDGSDGESEGGDENGEGEAGDEGGDDAGDEVVTETVASSEDVEEDADEADGSELADTGDWAWAVAAGFAAAGLLAIWASMAMRRRGRNA